MEPIRYLRIFARTGNFDPRDAHTMQGFVLDRCLPPDVSWLLHTEPQKLGQRIYRPIVYSEPLRVKDFFVFLLGGSLINAYFRRITDWLCDEGVDFEVLSVHPDEVASEKLFVSLSPVYLKRGRRPRYVYPPGNGRRFEEELAKHLKRKSAVLLGEEVNCRVRVVRGRRVSRVYGGRRLPAYSGVFRIEGDPRAKFVACLMGLGSRTAQGFSMVVPVGATIS